MKKSMAIKVRSRKDEKYENWKTVAVKERLGSELGRQVYADLEAKMNAFMEAREECFGISEQSAAEATAYLNTNVTPLANEVSEVINTMLSDKSRIGQERSDSAVAQSRLFEIIIIGTIIAAVAVSVVVAARVTRQLTNPIHGLQRSVKELLAGKLDTVFQDTARDEIGSLAESMRYMTESLRHIIGDVNHITEELAGTFWQTAGKAAIM